MATILDHRRAELDARIMLLEEEIEARTRAFEAEVAALQASKGQLVAQRRELDDYVPAVDPDAE